MIDPRQGSARRTSNLNRAGNILVVNTKTLSPVTQSPSENPTLIRIKSGLLNNDVHKSLADRTWRDAKPIETALS